MGMAGGNIQPFYTTEFQYSTTSATAETVGTFDLGQSAYTSNKILLIQVRAKVGKQKDASCYGTDTICVIPTAQRSGATPAIRSAVIVYKDGQLGQMSAVANSYGIYATAIDADGKLTLSGRYSAYSGDISGTWVMKAYLLDFIGDNPILDIE